ncbi:MAG: hypothetical protein AB4426_09185 [Xenococcaceae cyanobacterium]
MGTGNPICPIILLERSHYPILLSGPMDDTIALSQKPRSLIPNGFYKLGGWKAAGVSVGKKSHDTPRISRSQSQFETGDRVVSNSDFEDSD